MDPINNKLEWVAKINEKSPEVIAEKTMEFTALALSKINKISDVKDLNKIASNISKQIGKLEEKIDNRKSKLLKSQKRLDTFKSANKTKVVGSSLNKKSNSSDQKLTLLLAKKEYYENVLNTALMKNWQLNNPSSPPSSSSSTSSRSLADSSSNTSAPTTQIEKTSSEGPVGVEVGVAVVMEGSKPLPLSIYQWTDKNNCICLHAYIKGTTHKVGEMKLDWIRTMSDPVQGTHFRGEYFRTGRGYGPNDNAGNPPNQDLPKIYLSEINNLEFLNSEGNKNIKGVGSALFQVAIEYSFARKCEGRIQLTAVENSHGFHYLQGMRTMGRNTPEKCQKVDKTIYEELEKVKKAKENGEKLTANTEELYDVEMYLPDEAIEIWKKKISENPILYPLNNS